MNWFIIAIIGLGCQLPWGKGSKSETEPTPAAEPPRATQQAEPADTGSADARRPPPRPAQAIERTAEVEAPPFEPDPHEPSEEEEGDEDEDLAEYD